MALKPAVLAAIVGRRRRETGAAVDATQSTFTASAFANAADGATSTTLTFTAKDAAVNVVPNAPLTWSVERITLAAGDVVVTASPATIDDDGADRSYILATVENADRPIRGIPAANCVLAATGAGNTVTQPATATDLNGQTSGHLVSTVAATKVASYTVLGVAITDTASVVVEAAGVPTTYATANFDAGTFPDVTNPYADRVTIMDDPTPRATGKVVELTFAPASGGSMGRAVVWTKTPGLDYGEELWFKGSLFQQSGTGNYDANHNRKLMDWQGAQTRCTLHRRNGVLRMSIVSRMSGSETETIAETTGITINDDTWYQFEVRTVMNSADLITDGVLEIYIDGEPTPSYQRSTGIGWITEQGGAKTTLEDFLVGSQLTIDSGDGTYEDTRYWDTLFFSDGRL